PCLISLDFTRVSAGRDLWFFDCPDRFFAGFYGVRSIPVHVETIATFPAANPGTSARDGRPADRSRPHRCSQEEGRSSSARKAQAAEESSRHGGILAAR